MIRIATLSQTTEVSGTNDASYSLRKQATTGSDDICDSPSPPAWAAQLSHFAKTLLDFSHFAKYNKLLAE